MIEIFMGIVNLDEIRPGMILATDMRTNQGRLLLQAGSKIEEEHLKIARIWGVTQAAITKDSARTGPDNPLEKLDPELKKVLDALTDWKFACCDRESALFRKLALLFQKRIASTLTRKNARKIVEQYRGPKILGDIKHSQSNESEKPNLEKLVESEVSLVTLPDVFHEIVEVTGSPKSSSTDISNVLAKDQSLSSRILRLVNSPFYGLMSKVDTLSRAVTIVGTVEITNLAMGISITSTFNDISSELVNMRDFWEHSLAVGVVAKILATQNKMPVQERLFVGGLLHDIGRLVLLKNYSQISGKMLAFATSRPVNLCDLEIRCFGFSHSELGARLLKEWKVPQALTNMVRNHHSRSSMDDSGETLLIRLADIIAHGLGCGHSGARRVPSLDYNEWKNTGMSITALPVVAAQAENNLRDLMRIIVEDQAHAV